jgi:hypothetical protein
MRCFSYFLSVCVALCVLSSDAAAYKKIKCFMPQAPEISLAGVKKVAVLDFTVNGGDSPDVGQFISNQMVKYLLQEGRGITEISGGIFSSSKEGRCLIPNLETGCFQVIERSRLQAVMAEAGIGESGLVQPDQSKKLGELAGIDVIITGDASSQIKNTSGTEVHKYNENKQEYSRQVECLQRKVTVVANIRILDAKTGEILASRQESRSVEDKKCADSGKEIRGAGEMVGACASTIAWQFTNLFCPWFVLEEFELDKVKVKETKDEADKFCEAAENLDLPKAYAGFDKLYKGDSYNPQYLYNMGVLYEVSGDFGKAKEMYDGAASLMDEKRYKESAARIGKRVALVEFYKSIEHPITPFDMTAAAAAVDVTSRFVVVKGSKNDRFDFYATPDLGAESVAKVPGGVRLKILEEKDGWVRVELLGGKQGYISGEKVEKAE